MTSYYKEFVDPIVRHRPFHVCHMWPAHKGTESNEIESLLHLLDSPARPRAAYQIRPASIESPVRPGSPDLESSLLLPDF